MRNPSYLRHIRNIQELLAGRHVANDAEIQRVHDLAVRGHQAVVKHSVFADIE